MYEVGDRVFLTDGYDKYLNIPGNRGKEVKIIEVDKDDYFLPYFIKTISGRTHWIDGEAIKEKVKFLGIKL